MSAIANKYARGYIPVHAELPRSLFGANFQIADSTKAI
jgi:hypothetical protein